MKIGLLIILLISFVGGGISQGNDSVVRLKLRKKRTTITIKSDSNFLYRWQQPNIIYVYSENDEIPIASVRGQNLEVKKLSQHKYQLYPKYSDTLNYQGGKVRVYCKNRRGKIKLHTVKEFKFIDPPMPVISIAGVRSDSIIKRKNLVLSELKASYKGKKCKVLAYTLVYADREGEQKIIEFSGKFPIHVRNIFRTLRAGSTIKFQDIKIALPGNVMETIKLQTFFLDDDIRN